MSEKQMSAILRFPFLAMLLTVLVIPVFSWSDTVVSCTHRLTWTDDVVRANAVVALNRNEARQQLELLVSDGCLNNVKGELQKLGATISFDDERLGYIDAVIPTEHLLDAFDISGIDAAV